MISAHNIVKAVLRQDMARSAYYRTRIDEDMELMKTTLARISTDTWVDHDIRNRCKEVLAQVDRAPAIAPFED